MSSGPAVSGYNLGKARNSPQKGRLDTLGDNPVVAPVTCVITRFKLRHAHDLIPTYLDYRRIMGEASQTPGLLRSAFLIEGPSTWQSLSIWAGDSAIPIFGTNVPAHVEAARRVFKRLAMRDGHPEIWSTKWRLASVSNNLTWGDFDLRQAILDMRD